MSQKELETQATRLLDGLVRVMEQSWGMKDDVPTKLLFRLLEMTGNNMSKAFFDSAAWIEPKYATKLLEQGIVQLIASESPEKYALTFRGIANCIQSKFGISMENQMLKFLELADQKFTYSTQTPLKWQEKLASLSLILMASTSDQSALRINNEPNKRTLNEVFDEVLKCLKKYGVVESGVALGKPIRGESPASALMSRLNDLPRKTNHFYMFIQKDSCYYFEIEKNGLDQNKLNFLFQKIFEGLDPNRDYKQLGGELRQISERYSEQFMGRKFDPLVALNIRRELEKFMDEGVLRLHPRP